MAMLIRSGNYDLIRRINPILTMMKGKTLTTLVLVIEIACIAVLHAVKINQSEKSANKEITKNNFPEPIEGKPKTAAFTLAVFR
jgi:hypothetical protein